MATNTKESEIAGPAPGRPTTATGPPLSIMSSTGALKTEGKSIRVNDYTGTAPSPNALRHGLASVTIPSSLDKSSANYIYPYDAYAYFANPAVPNAPRAKDQYILISAGIDGKYGTKDDKIVQP